MIGALDEQVGAILAALARHDIARDTIVVFTSDNGGERYADVWPFSGQKTELLEGGLRVPAAIAWPAKIAPASVGGQATITMDWVPTLLAAAGAAPAQDYPTDGMNLLPMLLDGASPVPRGEPDRRALGPEDRRSRRLNVARLPRCRDCSSSPLPSMAVVRGGDAAWPLVQVGGSRLSCSLGARHRVAGEAMKARVSDGGATASAAGSPGRARAKDVAEAVGVSQSTVSRTFRAGGSVAPDMRAKVVAAARALGYRPNAMARAVITRRSNVVAIILASETALYYPEVLVELTRAVARAGLHVMLFTLDAVGSVGRAVDEILSYQVDGVIALVDLGRRDIATLADAGVAVVLYNRSSPGGEVDTVGCTHHESGRRLGRHLLGLGHARIGLVDGPSISMLAKGRGDGVVAALGEAGIGADAVARAAGDFTYDGGFVAARTLLAAAAPPTAIVAANDAMALGVVDAARAMGLKVPDELSVAGFDGILSGNWLAYGLATMVQPVTEIARAAVALIEQRRDDPERPAEHRLFACNLRDGASIAAPATR